MSEAKEHVSKTSINLAEERLQQLADLFPEAFREGKLDVDSLRATIGENVLDSKTERFSFTWAGKRDAIRLAQTPSRATLIPAPDESVNWNTTSNAFIEGDNLEALKLIGRSYFGRVKMIYLDPPYNTGNDFIYPDNYNDPLETYLQMTGQVDSNGNRLSSNAETSGRYHSTWLSMMYPRLVLARQFLRDDGVIFISIDDKELHNLRQLMNEVFGEENSVGIISWRNVTDNNPTLINKDNEFILCYARSLAHLPQEWKSIQSDAKDLLQAEYERLKVESENPEDIQRLLRQFISDNVEVLGNLTRYKNVDEEGIYTGSESVHNPRAGGYDFEVIHPDTQKPMRKPANGYRFPEATFRQMEKDDKILYGEDEKRIVKIKKYLSEFVDVLRSVIVLDGRLGSYDLRRLFQNKEKVFDNPKPVQLILSLISYVTDRDSIVLDFFAGSGTTAQAVLELNRRDGGTRRFILIQLPEKIDNSEFGTISGITKKRVELAIESLKNPDDKKRDESGRVEQEDLGFRVFKLAPSNYRQWQPTEDTGEIMQQLELMADTLLVANWKPEDVIFEVAVKEGYGLNIQIEQLENIEANTVFHVTDPDKEQTFYICLDEQLPDNLLIQLGLTQDDLFICLDSALNDSLAANFALQARLKTL